MLREKGHVPVFSHGNHRGASCRFVELVYRKYVKILIQQFRNEGNAPITLSLQTANWNPAKAADYISLSWNYGGQAIGAEDSSLLFVLNESFLKLPRRELGVSGLIFIISANTFVAFFDTDSAQFSIQLGGFGKGYELRVKTDTNKILLLWNNTV